MRTMILLILVSSCTFGAQAQGTLLKEWFSQKATQKEYLATQIAVLKVYAGYVKKGYDIYNEGLTAIGHFKNGEFKLHKDYFLSLKSINPEIARYPRVRDIEQLLLRTEKTIGQTMGTVHEGGHFHTGEVNYLLRVFDQVIIDCSMLVDELIILTTPDKLELRDDERLVRIELLYHEMLDKNRFAEGFCKEIILLQHSREQEKRAIKYSKQINDLNTN